MKTVWTPGDDPRMILAAIALCRKGFERFQEASEGGADRILCPPGWGEEKLLPIAERLAPGGVLAVGRETPALLDACRARGGALLPLLSDPDYLAANALATAEGTLAEAIRLLPRTLRGEVALVLGYGACGREIARLFAAAGCRVCVWSHPGSLARANADGFPTGDPASPPDAALVINTVPRPDFLPRLAAKLAPETLFLQVASGPVPEDKALAAQGVRCVALPGLPGRFSPESEARAVLSALARRQADALPVR